MAVVWVVFRGGRLAFLSVRRRHAYFLPTSVHRVYKKQEEFISTAGVRGTLAGMGGGEKETPVTATGHPSRRRCHQSRLVRTYAVTKSPASCGASASAGVPVGRRGGDGVEPVRCLRG